MKWSVRFVSFCVVATMLSACSAPLSVHTPQGKTAYSADAIVVRVNELQAAAIQAEATKGISTATATTIVKFTVDADKVLKATPAGWQATVATLWAQAKKNIPAAQLQNQSIAAVVLAVDTVLAAYAGGTR